MATPVSADATVIPASGGIAIPATTAGVSWTTLGSIVITEGAAGDIATGMFVLTVPSGFEFNTSSVPNVAVTGTTPQLTASSPAVITSTTITVTVTASSTTEADVLTIGGSTPIQVRPTAVTPLASGNIKMTFGTITGVTLATNLGTLNEVPGPIHHYAVSTIHSNQIPGTPFDVTIQAKDIYDNNIITGATANETVNISFGLADAGASPTSCTTSHGAAMVRITMTVEQGTQSITFTGATSARTGTSNTFNVFHFLTPQMRIMPRNAVDLSLCVNPSAIVTQTITAKSYDNNCQVTFAKGITIKTAEGAPLHYVRMSKQDTPPPPPDDASIIGIVYDFYPSGAIFNPAATVNITYDPSELPEGVSEKNLVIAYYDATATEWEQLDSSVDIVANAVIANISHFTDFTVIANTRPAAFSVTDLTISPAEIDAGQTVTIQVLITNTGDLTGDYPVTLTIDDADIATEDVTLTGCTSQTVTFTVMKDTPGSYSVNINGQSDMFTVNAPPVPESTTPEPEPAPEPEPEPAPAPEPALTPEPAPAPEPEPTQSAGVNWGLLGGGLIACVILGLISWYLIRRLRANRNKLPSGTV